MKGLLAFAASTLSLLLFPGLAAAVDSPSDSSNGPPQDFVVGSYTGVRVTSTDVLHISFSAHLPADSFPNNSFGGKGEVVANLESVGETVKGDLECGFVGGVSTVVESNLVYRLRQPAPAEFLSILAADNGPPRSEPGPFFPDLLYFSFLAQVRPPFGCGATGVRYDRLSGNVTIHDAQPSP